MTGKFQKGGSPEFETFLKSYSSLSKLKLKEKRLSREKAQAHSFHPAFERRVEEWVLIDHSREATCTAGLPCYQSRASRSHSISSHRPSITGFAEFLCPPVTPDPAFIAISAAGQIVTQQHDNVGKIWADQHWLKPSKKTALIAPSMLKLVNQFLDQLLFDFLSVLSVSKSTSLRSLRSAVTEVLEPKLAEDTINGADRGLHEYLGDIQAEYSELEPTSDWNLELIWKQIQLRCMVYSSLGDMDEEDEVYYTDQEQLRVAFPAVAIFLTSILEHIGEFILMVVAQAAYHRSRTKHEQEEGTNATSKIDDHIVVEETDLVHVALDRTLGRLWRKFMKRINPVTAPTARRGNSSTKAKMLTKWQKAFQTTPLWDPDNSWKEIDVRNKLTRLEQKHREDTISMIRQCSKEDPFFLTIHDIYFGRIWFNKEVIRMIERTSILLTVASLYAPAESTTRTFDAADKPTSVDSEPDGNDDGTAESEESYDSMSSGTQDVADGSLIQPLIVASKQKLIDCLMEHFWVLLEQMQDTNIVGHASEASSTRAKTAPSSTAPSAELSSLKGSRRTKRRLREDNGADSEEDGQNKPTPPKESSAVSDPTKSNQGFACPYRKHNPRKYGIDGWRPCALTPHNTIARVK
jgi:hypothetical protein